MSAAERYLAGQFRPYFATWLPGEVLHLGDVGVVHGGVFRRQSTLASFGVPFDGRVDAFSTSLEHSSKDDVRITVGADADAAAQGWGARVSVELGSSGAFVFQARGCRGHSIVDLHGLGEHLRQAWQEGRWDLDWVVVDKVQQAESATILVASAGQARLELGARAALEAGPAALASGKAKLEVTAQHGEVTSFLVQEGLTPLYQLSRLHRRLLSQRTEVLPVRGADGPGQGGVDEEEAALERVLPAG